MAWEFSKGRLGWRLAWRGSTEKKEASHFLELRGRHQHLDQLKQRFLCGFRRIGDQGGGGPNGQIVSVKRAADRRRQRSREIIDEEREKFRVKNRSLPKTSTDLKGTAFVILINQASAPIKRKD